MYFPTFFPTVARPFDARPLGVPMDMPTVLSGREREIPLDLSLKTVRPPGDATPEDYLLLDQRKYLGLGRPANFLDPAALFRLPYRMDVPYPFCTAAASPISHSAAVMSGLIQQQRERCLETVCPRTGHPVNPYLDPGMAALSLHLRNGVALAPQPRTAPAPVTGPNFYGPLGVIPTSAGPYPLFPDFLQPSADRRTEVSKGAFTSVHRRTPDKPNSTVPSCPTSTSSPFLPTTSSLEARYVEHLQRLRDSSKCTAACCTVLAPTSSSSSTPSNCSSCLPGSSSHPGSSCLPGSCRKDGVKNCEGFLNLVTPPTSRPPVPSTCAGDIRMNPFCSLPEVAPLFAPVTTATSSGVWSPASKMAAVASPAQKRKEGVAQKESPRAARDFPAPPAATAPTTPDVKPVIVSHREKTKASHREPDVMIIEEKKHRPFVPSAFNFNRSPSPTLKFDDASPTSKRSLQFDATSKRSLQFDAASTTSPTSKRSLQFDAASPTSKRSLQFDVASPSDAPPPTKMPRLEAASRNDPPPEPWSPAGPPPLLPAVVPDICRPLFGDAPFSPDPSSYGKLIMRLPKTPSGVPFEIPAPNIPFVAKSEIVLPSCDSSFTTVVATPTSADVPLASSPVETKPELKSLIKVENVPATSTLTTLPADVKPKPSFFQIPHLTAIKSKTLSSTPALTTSSALLTPVKTPQEQAEEAKRQRALQLYSDLSEIDQQDKDGQKCIRLREIVDPDSIRGSLKFKVTDNSSASTSQDLKRKSDSPVTLTSCTSGASAVEEGLRQEALRLADARAKKRLRRRLLERLHSEKTAGNSDDDTESQEDGDDEDDEGRVKDGKEDGKPLERRLLSQMNLTWRQRRLLYSCRRRRFRSGLDMVHRHRKKPKPIPPEIKLEIEAEKARRLAANEEILAKVSSEGGAPPEMKRLMVNKALGETILHRAARQCYLEVVLYCLETKCCDVNARDNAGYTPLHECCSRGHLQVARAMLQYGSDVNASAAGGIRPLHDAVENDHVECVRLLLSYGADPTIATYSGLSPLKLARSPIMTEFLRGFMSDISGDSDGHPVLPWHFQGSSSCLDPSVSGFNVLDGAPSDDEASMAEGEGAESGHFVFEVSDSPLLPSFRLYLPPTSGTADKKVLSNCLRLSDVLKQTGMTKDDFRRHYNHLDLITVPRHEFEAGAACSQLLTGTRLDSLLAASAMDEDPGYIDVLRLDNQLRQLLGIETITLR